MIGQRLIGLMESGANRIAQGDQQGISGEVLAVPVDGFFEALAEAGDGLVADQLSRGRDVGEGVLDVARTRLSCHDFVDTQVRLQLSALAYNIGNSLSRLHFLTIPARPG